MKQDELLQVGDLVRMKRNIYYNTDYSSLDAVGLVVSDIFELEQDYTIYDFHSNDVVKAKHKYVNVMWMKRRILCKAGIGDLEKVL